MFDAAMESQFKCGKCNETLEFIENKERVNEIERRLGELSGQRKFEEE